MFIYDFHFPYKNFRFPGQYTEEKILYVTRQAPIFYKLKILAGILGFLLFDAIILFIINSVEIVSLNTIFTILLLLLNLIALPLIFYWVKNTFNKTLFIITTKRLIQFVQTSPFTHFQLSLSLPQIVDTAASRHNYFQSLFKIGNFFARSGAGAEGDFLVQNIETHEDLHNYVNKMLSKYSQSKNKDKALDNFRPFIPKLKGKSREEFLKNKKY